MADPFSIVAGAGGLLDISVRLTLFLKNYKASVATLEKDLAALQNEVEALQTISKSIEDTCEIQEAVAIASHGEDVILSSLWRSTRVTLSHCRDTIQEAVLIRNQILGRKGPKVDRIVNAVKLTHRKRSKESDLHACRERLQGYLHFLNVQLSQINIRSTQVAQVALSNSFRDIAVHIQGLGTDFQRTQLSICNGRDVRGLLEHQSDIQLKKSVQDVLRDSLLIDTGKGPQALSLHGANVPSNVTVRDGLVDRVTSTILTEIREVAASSGFEHNKYFTIPQPVSNMFTGRGRFLIELTNTFISPPEIYPAFQSRFVIYGMGGSGKSQFCSKFAEDNRDSFWGVFSIDASSIEQIRQSYALIASIAGVEPHENAAIHWLANIPYPWLLIIDNADDPLMSLENHFPTGNRGHILIITRNSEFRVHGNVGRKSLEFGGLDMEEAKGLLLRAAEQPLPWESISPLAYEIVRTLGYLPLAITSAGATIKSGLCSMQNYLKLYENTWQRRRSITESAPKLEETIYWILDMCYRSISATGDQESGDAIEFLKLFAFLHRENIKFTIIQRAMNNAKIEESVNEGVESEYPHDAKMQSLHQSVRNMTRMTTLLRHLYLSSTGPPPLPKLIREARTHSDTSEFETRARSALRLLERLSLITHDKTNDSYSMHPVIHSWARDGGEMMTLSEQGLYLETAAMTLAASILLPPLSNGQDEDRYKREILPHINSVLMYFQDIHERLVANQKKSWRTWASPKPSMSPLRTVMFAKFSFVYMHNGKWKNAELLQRQVHQYLTELVGLKHSTTRKIQLGLAVTSWNLGRIQDAANLQKEVLDTCLELFHAGHPEVLRAKDFYAKTLWQSGRYAEAFVLQEEVVSGFKRTFGMKQEDTLRAIDNLARTTAKFREPHHLQKAYEMHKEVVKGMSDLATLGPVHEDTLVAKESLAQTCGYMGSHLPEALELIEEVVDIRRGKFGEEHPYTLMAMVSLAILLCLTGEHDSAIGLVEQGLPVAIRNLGKDHMGTLFGHSTLGSIHLAKGNYDKAEEILVDAARRQKYMLSQRGDYHPDRIGSLIELTKVYFLQGKLEDAIVTCEEVILGLSEISSQEHPFSRDAKAALVDFKMLHERTSRGEDISIELERVRAHKYRMHRMV